MYVLTEPNLVPYVAILKTFHVKIVNCVTKTVFHSFPTLVTHLSQNMRKRLRNAKNKKCIVGYFASLFSHFFAFCISCQGQHARKKSKDFIVYFFAALIKHEICMKYEKYIVSVSYFAVCFTKTFAK